MVESVHPELAVVHIYLLCCTWCDILTGKKVDDIINDRIRGFKRVAIGYKYHIMFSGSARRYIFAVDDVVFHRYWVSGYSLAGR